MIWEIFRALITGAIIFYASINFGFLSPYESQITPSIWIDVFYKYYRHLDELSQNPSNVQENNSSEQHLIKSIKIPLIPAADSTKKNIELGKTPNLIPIDSLKKDSLRTSLDTLKVDSLKAALDTVKVDSMAIDSTARLKYFHYKRTDLPYVTLSLQKHSSFFAQPTQGTTRTVTIDSTGNYVEIHEVVAGEKPKILLRLPIDQYLKLQLALNEQKDWNTLIGGYQIKSNKKELGELIKDITNLEIPLPSVGVLSIFGKPKISLRIGGAVDIHGAWRSQTTEGVTTSQLGNTQSEPDFQQQVQINVDGTIGDKLNINADWNTERTFEYQNQLHIKYTGYEDEIVQSVEAGNVSLQGSPLVGSSDALFGIKAEMKLGPLTLTTLASQKKGETKEVAVNSGSTSQNFSIRAYSYATNNYFLDTTYASTYPDYNFFQNHYGHSIAILNQNNLFWTVKDIQVWKSVNTITVDQSKERFVNAYMHLPPLTKATSPNLVYNDSLRQQINNPTPGLEYSGRFVMLQNGVDYTVHPETGYITFNTQIQDQDAIAVAFRIEGPTSNADDDRYYGEFVNAGNTDSTVTNQTLVLKLVKPDNLKPGGAYTDAWRLLLKNIYPLGGTQINQQGFKLDIKYDPPVGDPVNVLTADNGKQIQLLNAFGLDLYDNSGNPNPDGNFDWRPQYTILPDVGEIIFPNLEPFGQNLPTNIPDSLAYQSIYDTLNYAAQQDKLHDRWEIDGQYSGQSSSTYNIGFNVVENSVKVILNGRELVNGVDYSVDYNVGQVTILNRDALVPGANLKITYEQNDLFSLASKTLLGARGIFNISDRTKLGFSILNLNQQTLNDKVRIGEEPMSNTIMGVDFNTSADLPFLTNALDHIISTKQMSSISLAGEYARMNPDPNTMKSTISDDQGQSIAYIDDFEGAKKIIPIGVSYGGWKDLSPPDSLELLPGLTPAEKMRYKAMAWWYSITPSDVQAQYIWPKRSVTQQNQVPVMDFVFDPDTPGTYNWNPVDLKKSSDSSWGGMMKYLSSGANNLQSQNIQYIEFWLQADPNTPVPPNANLYIDLGRISEEVIPGDEYETEDRNNNGVVDANEDTGIDTMFDAQERQYCKERGYYTQNKPDPSNDDFALPLTANPDPFAYFHANGTEGNAANIDLGRIPDTGDLNLNGKIDLVNSYFRYTIPIDSNEAKKENLIAGESDNQYHWFLYRIPLQNFTNQIGNPTLTDIEYIRVFVQGVSQMVHVRFAEFDLVGNQWQQALPYDTVMSVSVVNLEDNPDYYMPPGLTRELDRTQTTTTVYKNEQSMDLIVKGLEPDSSREAVDYLYRPLDVFNYKQMKMFIHGDETGANIANYDTSKGTYTAQVYFRFGSDTNNFYEYRQPIKPGWRDITIDFSKLTAIKQQADSSSLKTTYRVPVEGLPGNYYGVRGNPSLTAIKYFTVGIINVSRSLFKDPQTLSGDIWVDELRVIGADNHPGSAYTLSTSIKLADLMNINFNLSHTDPYFHGLSDRFGSRVDSKNWSLSADIDLLKLLPIPLPGSSLRLSYSHSESIGKPLYMPGTDILVSQAADAASRDTLHTPGKLTAAQILSNSQTISTSDSWAASNIAIKIPSDSWLIKDTFNAVTLGFNYNKTFSRNPTTISSKMWVWNANMNYNVNFSQNNFFYPAKIPVIGSILGLLSDYKNLRIFYSPQSFAFNMSASRNRSVTVNRQIDNSATAPIYNHDFTTTRGFNFSWMLTDGGLLNLSTSYNVNINSSLAYLEADSTGIPYSESSVWRQIFRGAFFGRDYQYTQNVDVRTNPRLPSLWDIDKYFNLSAGYTVSYQWSNNFSQKNAQGLDAGRSAGFSSRTSLGLRLSLKSLMAPLFAEKPEFRQTPNFPGETNNRERNFNAAPGNQNPNLKNSEAQLNDSTRVRDSLAAISKKKFHISDAILFLKSFARIILFDYDNISINFSNDNSVSKGSLLASGTGFGNFWNVFYSQNAGPSRLFMLGLSSDVGKRTPDLSSLNDVFSQKNNLDIQTSRPLWEGAKIDLDWKVGWSVNKNVTLRSDSLGNTFNLYAPQSTGSISRSFFSLPPVLFLSAFKSGIKRVNELYDPNAADPNASLSNAFVQGFETLPWLSKLPFLQNVANYIPRPNWSITWDGLEKYYPFKSIAERVSLEHSYSSGYTEGWYISPDGKKIIQSQRIDYGFSPLIGLNMTFAKLWTGNMSGSIKYSTHETFDLGVSTQNITESFSKDIGISASYQKSGFELPLFGISLKNDIEFTFSYTNSQTSTIIYDMKDFKEGGTPQDGTSRVTIEPRIKYTISSKVTLAVFYTRTSVTPVGASRIPPTTTNEAGLDVHISIQ